MKKDRIIKWSRPYKILKYIFNNWNLRFDIKKKEFNKFRLCFLFWIPYIKYSEEVIWILEKRWYLYKFWVHWDYWYSLTTKWIEKCKNLFT